MLGLYSATQYRALESQYKKADKLAKELQARVNDLESKAESSKLLVDYNELKISHQALVAKEAIEAKTIETLDAAVQEYKTKIAALSSSDTGVSTKPNNESKEKITDIAKEVNNYKEEIKSLQDKIISLSKENENINNLYASTSAKLEALNKNAESYQLTAAKSEKRSRELEEINKNLSKSLNDLKQENENLSKDKNILITKEATFKNRIAELEAENEKLRSEAKNAKTIDTTASNADSSKGEVVTIRVKESKDSSVVFKANGEVIKDFVQFYKGSSVTIECYKDGKLTDSFIVEEN